MTTKRLNILINFKQLILISFLLLIIINPAYAQKISSQYEVLYPNIYIEKEKALMEKFIAEIKSWEKRGPIDVKALISGTLPKDTPGVGPTIKVTEAMVRYDNQKYDPENRVGLDADYARKLGYKDIFPFLTFLGYDDYLLTPYPSAARDQMFPNDLNHNITSYLPIYPGDTLYLVMDAGEITDLTPVEGSILRSTACQFKASVYNQKGEKVSSVIYRSTRNTKIFKEGKRPASFTTMDAPDWQRRPAHVYTDDDWAIIKDIWSKEKRQGAAPLYWEDVKIGDEPTWTLDGPVLESVTPTAPYGMGTGGSRTLKKEIMDPSIFKTMIRDANGIYRMPKTEDNIPAVPDVQPRASAAPGGAPPAGIAPGGTRATAAPPGGEIVTADIHKATEKGRANLINFMGRDFAIRHINNYMGDYGYISNIRWSIMDPRQAAAYGKPVPSSPYAEHYLDRVPKMKGRHVNAHGITGDVGIVKSYVYDKAIRNGEYFVELVWWVESIDGYIWEEGGATVRLPSKNVK